MPDVPDYLRDLNPEQLAAVRHEGKSLLILAGAGSGKTRVITTKIAWLVRERGFAPESILAVTFTNKAAREMQERAAAIDPACSRAFLRTFHSFGAWFLRRNSAAAALDPHFTIYDDEDSVTLLHGLNPEMTRSECSRLASRMARAKDHGLSPDSPNLEALFPDRNFRRMYSEYERRLRETGNADFGDLILLPARILRSDDAIRNRFHQRFRVILVDEYQDSNIAQFELLKALAGTDAYVCVVGDDDQSIYRFRGAEVRNILEFPDSFPGTDVVRLERNYRSFQSILDVAGAVVEKNEGRLGKSLKAVKDGGSKPVVALLSDQDEEAAYVARVAERRIARGGRWSDLAVLYRTNAQSLSFERLFSRRGIPYRIVGSVRFYEREEVKDALAYLAVLANPRDEVNFRRIVNKPARGVGDTSVQLVLEAAYASDGDLLSASGRAGPSLKTAKSRAGLAAFVSQMDKFRALLDSPGKPTPLSGLVEKVVKDSGLADYHKGQDEVAGTQRAANLDELVNAAADFELSFPGLAEFLETIELDRRLADQEESLDAVTLITMHNTKGLEFPAVVVTGLEQGLFPRDDDEGEDLEEQRRLFYVAATRAKEELHLTACGRRMVHGRPMENGPSKFLYEIPQDFYESLGGRLPASGGAQTGPWKPGLAVYHDDHGSGYVVQVKSGTDDTGPLVFVRFETGRILQFFPKFTRKLEAMR